VPDAVPGAVFDAVFDAVPGALFDALACGEVHITPREQQGTGRPIVLTTDFGLADAYAGVMRGVVLGINPGATVIDLTHLVQPQNVLQAAFILGTSYRFFPAGSIHVAVVDPGVGTKRRALLLVTPVASFVAPDNGILSCVVGDYLDEAPDRGGMVALPSPLAAYSLDNSRYWLHPVSRTFHGRDIFAPVAAHLSLGVASEEFGRAVNEMVWLAAPQPESRDNGIHGEVVYADHFGNLVTNIPAGALEHVGDIHVEVKGRRIAGLADTFGEGEPGTAGGLIALVGSHGYLEVAVRNGSAALTLGAGVGEPVRVTEA
jgi:S-adenosylmethionine hydrolase